MTIQEKVDQDLKQALKNHEETKLSVLRMLKTALKNAEIAKKGELTDEDTLKVLSTQSKQRKDSISQYENGSRQDLADKEKEELQIIAEYLPEQMSEEDIRKIVVEKVSEAGEGANFGQIMGAVMREVGQNADGQAVRKILEEEMGK